jgi:TonB family protein
VENAAIAQSSGSSELDDEAKLCVSGWLYTPAMKDGRPIASWNKVTISWEGRGEGSAKAAQEPARRITFPIWKSFRGISCELWHQSTPNKAELAFDVEIDGSVKNVALIKSSGNPSIDKDAMDCIAKRIYKPGIQNGQPIELRITTRMY